MLILIVGITGNVGHYLAEAALAAGHAIRGLSRNPDKLKPDLAPKLESFVKSVGYDDIAALDRGCAGVEAIICAYPEQPLLILDGQLLLLRAAERAGVRRFHSASWNGPWDKMAFGDVEAYDSFIAFRRQAELSSPIKPLFAFIGIFARTFFAVPGAGDMEKDKAFWLRKDGQNRQLNVIGTGDELINWTTEKDAAAFSIALVTSDRAERGGCYEFCSDTISLKQVKDTYLKLRPEASVDWNAVPFTIDQLEATYKQMRNEAKEADKVGEQYINYLGFVYAVGVLSGHWLLTRVSYELFPAIKPTTLEEYMKNAQGEDI